MNYRPVDISGSARAGRQQARPSGRGPFLARARRLPRHALPESYTRRGRGLALRLALCLCWCAGIVFFAGFAPFAGGKNFPGSARTAEAAESGTRGTSGPALPATDARQPAAGPAAGTDARKSGAPDADPLGAGALTRELTRLLRPERTPARPPEQPVSPPLSPESVPTPAASSAPHNEHAGDAGKPGKPEESKPAGTSANPAAAPAVAPPKPPEKPKPAVVTPPKTPREAAAGETKSSERDIPPRPASAEADNRTKPAGPREGKGLEASEAISRQNIVRAEIKPVNLTVLSAPYDGAIAAILARDGDSVDKDQAVIRLDTRAEEQALAAAEALAAETFDRLGALPEGPSREREALAAEYVRQSAQVKTQQARLAQGVITAPFAGTVTEVHAKAGEHVKQGAPIVEIAESGSLEIVCAVPSHWVRWLKPGHIVWVYVDETAKSYEAVLVRLGGKVDAASKTIRAYARFSSPQAELLPGMSGSASIRPQMVEEKNEEKAPPEQSRGEPRQKGRGPE